VLKGEAKNDPVPKRSFVRVEICLVVDWGNCSAAGGKGHRCGRGVRFGLKHGQGAEGGSKNRGGKGADLHASRGRRVLWLVAERGRVQRPQGLVKLTFSRAVGAGGCKRGNKTDGAAEAGVKETCEHFRPGGASSPVTGGGGTRQSSSRTDDRKGDEKRKGAGPRNRERQKVISSPPLLCSELADKSWRTTPAKPAAQ